MELILTPTDHVILDFFKLRMLSYQAHSKIGFVHSIGKVSAVISVLKQFVKIDQACESKILALSEDGRMWDDIMKNLESFVEQNILKSQVLRVNCVLAKQPSETQIILIQSHFTDLFPDKVVVINFETNESIIGGSQIEICGNMFDYSYAKRFNLLEKKILECLEDCHVH